MNESLSNVCANLIMNHDGPGSIHSLTKIILVLSVDIFYQGLCMETNSSILYNRTLLTNAGCITCSREP